MVGKVENQQDMIDAMIDFQDSELTSSEGKFLRITELSNAIDYLRQVVSFIDKVNNEPMMWKWVVIALHGALYSFTICACKGTNPDRVTRQRKKGTWLISFPEALRKCQNSEFMMLYYNSKKLVLNRDQRKAIRMLKETLRNEFEHYIPKGWYIELNGMPAITYHVLDVISFLALETGNVTYYKKVKRKKVESLLHQSKKLLSETRLWKEFEKVGEDPTACL